MFSETVNNGKENKHMRGLNHCHMTLDIKLRCIFLTQRKFDLHQKSQLCSSYPSPLSQVHIFTTKFPRSSPFPRNANTLLNSSVTIVVSVNECSVELACVIVAITWLYQSCRCRMFH
jgi:hypothetical protein